MTLAVRRKATYVDLFALPEHVVGENGGIQVTLRRVEVDRRALWRAGSASSNPPGPMLAQNYL